MPLITVIILNFQYRSFLRDCLDSVANQTYSNFEVLIFDDASGHLDVEVIKQLSKEYRSKIPMLRHCLAKENRGATYMINQWCKEAKGDYVFFVDADDWLKPDCLAQHYKHLSAAREENERCHFSYSDCFITSEAGKVIGEGLSQPFSKEDLKKRSFVGRPSLIVSKKLIETLPFDDGIRLGSIHHIWNRITADGGEGVYINKPLFFYRMHERNLSGIGKKITELKNVKHMKIFVSDFWPTAPNIN